MLPRSLKGALALGAFAVPAIVHAQKSESGTPAEARAMLDRAVVSMKANPAKTIDQINKGEGGFRDRDLYVFCLSGGKGVAHGADPTQVGSLQKDLKDVTGKPFGDEFNKAEEGKVVEVSYMFPRPGHDKTPVPKVALVTKVADHLCGVGHYK